MEISSPLCITSRLLPGCRIGGAEISIEYAGHSEDIEASKLRQRYRWYIDLGLKWVQELNMASTREFSGDGFYSGRGGGTLQEGLESLLGYLGAFAGAYEYQKLSGEEEVYGAHLFPAELAEWAIENADAITALELELREHSNKLIVE